MITLKIFLFNTKLIYSNAILHVSGQLGSTQHTHARVRERERERKNEREGLIQMVFHPKR